MWSCLGSCKAYSFYGFRCVCGRQNIVVKHVTLMGTFFDMSGKVNRANKWEHRSCRSRFISFKAAVAAPSAEPWSSFFGPVKSMFENRFSKGRRRLLTPSTPYLHMKTELIWGPAMSPMINAAPHCKCLALSPGSITQPVTWQHTLDSSTLDTRRFPNEWFRRGSWLWIHGRRLQNVRIVWIRHTRQ